MDWLTDEQCGRMTDGYCPDCGHRGFVAGPRGGNAQNIECGNLECRNRFNVSTFVLSYQIAMAHRIPKQSEGGADWESMNRKVVRRVGPGTGGPTADENDY